MTTIYLLRHGETMWNREDIFRGQADIPLNAFGRQQAKALSEALELEELHKPFFITSPLKRARETAEIAARSFNESKVIDNSFFLDLSYGAWEGKPLCEIEQKYPELYNTWTKHPEKVIFPGGENIKDAADRAEKGVEQAVQINPDRPTVIVAHRAINKALICRLLGLGMKAFWKIRQDTACLNKFHYNKSFFILARLNDTCHLQNLDKVTKDF